MQLGVGAELLIFFRTCALESSYIDPGEMSPLLIALNSEANTRFELGCAEPPHEITMLGVVVETLKYNHRRNKNKVGYT